MSKKTRDKIITNIILFLIVAGITAKLLPYFLIIFISFLLLRWLAKKF